MSQLVSVTLFVDASTKLESELRAEEFLTRAVSEFRKTYNVVGYEINKKRLEGDLSASCSARGCC